MLPEIAGSARLRHRIAHVTAPRPEGRGFLLQAAAGNVPVLRKPPQAETDSPSAFSARMPCRRRFTAALTSLSCSFPHAAQVQRRTESGSFRTLAPQPEQILLDANQRSAFTRRWPDHTHLYSSLRTNPPHAASCMCAARDRFPSMFLTPSVSTQIAWFSSTSRLDSLCWKSPRAFIVLSCALATSTRAFARLADPLLFLDRFFCFRRRLAAVRFTKRGFGVFRPELSTTTSVRPRSIPATLSPSMTLSGSGRSRPSSTRMEA